jgi:hypothetical protein
LVAGALLFSLFEYEEDLRARRELANQRREMQQKYGFTKKWASKNGYCRSDTWAILLGIVQQGSNQLRKTICHWKALNVL